MKCAVTSAPSPSRDRAPRGRCSSATSGNPQSTITRTVRARGHHPHDARGQSIEGRRPAAISARPETAPRPRARRQRRTDSPGSAGLCHVDPLAASGEHRDVAVRFEHAAFQDRLHSDEARDLLGGGRAEHLRGVVHLEQAAVHQHAHAVAQHEGLAAVVGDEHRGRALVRGGSCRDRRSGPPASAGRARRTARPSAGARARARGRGPGPRAAPRRPTSVRAWRAPRCAMPKRSSHVATRASTATAPRRGTRGRARRCAATVASARSGCWKTLAMRRLTARLARGASRLAAKPDLSRAGRLEESETRRSVDFPAPFGPMTARISPARTSSAGTSSTARPPCSTLTRDSSTTGTTTPPAPPSGALPPASGRLTAQGRGRCWIQVSAQFTRKVMRSRIAESAMATSKLPLPRLQHGGRGEDARRAPDVAAHHHRGADLGDHAAEAGHDGGEHGQPRLAQQHPDHLAARGAERQHLQAELRGHLLDRREGQAGHDGAAMTSWASTIAPGV